MTQNDIDQLQRQGCEALIVASYDWKVPDCQSVFPYAINFHCSPLPEGRGPYPVSRALLERRTSWAVTCHKLSFKIDQGDILAHEHFRLEPEDCHESLDLKIQMAAKRLAEHITKNLPDLWQKAIPQGEAVYWKKPTLLERVINFNKPVADVLRHIRAFGANESLAAVGDHWYLVKRAVGWPETHAHKPGFAAHSFNRSTVIAATDGYVGLLDISLAPDHLIAEVEDQMNSSLTLR
jgi:methionyl-tRNA formyltransferase